MPQGSLSVSSGLRFTSILNKFAYTKCLHLTLFGVFSFSLSVLILVISQGLTNRKVFALPWGNRKPKQHQFVSSDSPAHQFSLTDDAGAATGAFRHTSREWELLGPDSTPCSP